MWIQFNGPQSLIDGAGLRYVGNILNIGQGTGIVVNPDSIQFDGVYGDSQYLRLDATNTASNVRTSGQFISTLVTGSPPFVIASTTNVLNLNASSLNGATFASPGPIGSGIANTGIFTVLTATTVGGGTIWNGAVISSQYGGTGVNNSGKTLTLTGNLTLNGGFSTTIISTALTAVTLPPSGTLIGSNDINTVTNTMLLNSTISGVSLGNTLFSLTIGSGLLGTSYNGSSAITIKRNPVDTNTIIALPATGVLDVDLNISLQEYFTVDATANWTFNFRGNAVTTLDSMLNVGESIAVEIMVTNGATAYYPTTHQVDGVPVTLQYAGGTPFSTGKKNSIDQYDYKITKTGVTTYIILATQISYS